MFIYLLVCTMFCCLQIAPCYGVVSMVCVVGGLSSDDLFDLSLKPRLDTYTQSQGLDTL